MKSVFQTVQNLYRSFTYARFVVLVHAVTVMGTDAAMLAKMFSNQPVGKAFAEFGVIAATTASFAPTVWKFLHGNSEYEKATLAPSDLNEGVDAHPQADVQYDPSAFDESAQPVAPSAGGSTS